ncbi:hypothetical protein HD553DRAFT_325707 [Filobasidium floriforme]|uniref:uncharacterized protein n=1 Tax=Filobasidium floriforme TaxID=5210 RepID=UPI001E8D02B0|nr:uncharacterized protein HD553DRAFT_325707 [Filobasidium floriforme]KAH8081277.1 hypothetical protein HD553DRAFT_325707 [Filobasidium floriforme]
MTSNHPLFPPSAHLGVKRPIASSSTSTSTSNASPSPFPSTFTTKSTTPATTPPRSCRRPSPLRNNSFCSDDLDRDGDRDDVKRGRAEGEEEDADGDEDQGMMSSFCESIDENEAQGSEVEHDESKAKAQAGLGSEWKSASGLGAGSKFPLKREPSNRPKRRDSGSEVEDALELDFASPFVQAERTGKEDVDMHHSAGEVDPAEKPRAKSTSISSATSGTGTLAGSAGRTYPGSMGRTINYNPSHSTLSSNSTSKSSFIRPKPSFPRSAPLRPLTLASLSHSGGSSSGPILGAGGRYSTPHAGMMAAGSSGAGAAGKVAVPSRAHSTPVPLRVFRSKHNSVTILIMAKIMPELEMRNTSAHASKVVAKLPDSCQYSRLVVRSELPVHRDIYPMAEASTSGPVRQYLRSGDNRDRKSVDTLLIAGQTTLRSLDHLDQGYHRLCRFGTKMHWSDIRQHIYSPDHERQGQSMSRAISQYLPSLPFIAIFMLCPMYRLEAFDYVIQVQWDMQSPYMTSGGRLSSSAISSGSTNTEMIVSWLRNNQRSHGD